MTAFEGYHEVKKLPLEKFLVTKGFTKLQHSKVEMLGIAGDFEEVHIVDPQLSSKTKKEVFADIMLRYNYQPKDVLVLGDDPNSEIKAAKDLGIPTFLYDLGNKYSDIEVNCRSNRLIDIVNCLNK